MSKAESLTDNLLKVLGITPDRQFPDNVKVLILVKSPNELGIDPDKRFLDKDTSTRFRELKVTGVCPLKELLFIAK